MGFLEGVASFFEGVIGLPVKALEYIWKGIENIIALLVDTAQVLAEAWQAVETGVEYFVEGVANFSDEVFDTLWHILYQAIPEGITWAYDALYHELTSAITTVEHFIEHIYTTVRNWVEGLIREVYDVLHQWVQYLEGLVAPAIHWVETAGNTVLGWINHPDTLADFIAGHIVIPVLKWLLSTGRDVLKFIWESWRGYEVEAASQLEDFLKEVL